MAKCWNEILREPEFADVVVDLTTLETFSRGQHLSCYHVQSENILSEWFINGLPTEELCLSIARLSGIRGRPYDITIDYVTTVTFRWIETGWKPIKYTVSDSY